MAKWCKLFHRRYWREDWPYSAHKGPMRCQKCWRMFWLETEKH